MFALNKPDSGAFADSVLFVNKAILAGGYDAEGSLKAAQNIPPGTPILSTANDFLTVDSDIDSGSTLQASAGILRDLTLDDSFLNAVNGMVGEGVAASDKSLNSNAINAQSVNGADDINAAASGVLSDVRLLVVGYFQACFSCSGKKSRLGSLKV